MEVEELAFGGDGLKPVRESFGDQQAPAVGFVQQLAVPLEEGRRRRPEVDGHVEHLAAQASDHLGFRVRGPLEVQPADGARQAGERPIDLDDAAVAGKHGLQISLAEQPFEEAAGVAVRMSLQQVQPRQPRRKNREAVAHDACASSGVAPRSS